MTVWNYKNFTKDEMECKCGCGMLPTPDFMNRLQILRTRYGKPMKVTSGARCSVHNAKVGGSAKSKHVEGTAVDILCDGHQKYILTKLAIEMGFGGIGIASSFIHLDTRDMKESVIWTY